LHVAFSIREKVAESRMRGYFKLLIFLAFSIHKIPSPTTCVVPPLPKRARVFQSLADSTICQWARIFEPLIDL
jgi:hypothetical protein